MSLAKSAALFSIVLTAALAQNTRALVFYTETTANACQWRLLDARTGEKRTVFETAQCPEKIVWDVRHRETVYARGGSIYKVSWQGGAHPVELGSGSGIGDLWISRDTGLPRVAFPIKTTPKNTVTERGATYFVYKGRRYPMEKVVADGTRGMAVVEERSATGDWTVVAARSTAFEAGDAPGLFVVKKWMEHDPQSVTLQDLLETATCPVQDCAGGKFPPPAVAQGRIKTLFPEASKDEVVYEPLNAQEGVLFATAMGDTVHAMGPVYYCRQQCRDTKRLEVGATSQISVSVQAGCALITEEDTGDHAAVVCAGTSSPPTLLQHSHAAVWFPVAEMWQPGKP